MTRCTFTYSAKLPSSITSGAYTNTVDIPTYASYATNGDVYDDVPPAQATVTVGTAKADMAIVKTPNGSTEPGGTWTFTMDVSNVGPSDAEGPISVVDDLPDGLTYASNGPDWNCFPFDQTVFCAYAGPKSDFPSLQPAEHATPLILSVTIAATPENASYTNVAQVFSVTEDPNPDNDVSRATVAVSPTPIPAPPDPEKPVDPTDPNIPVDPDGPGASRSIRRTRTSRSIRRTRASRASPSRSRRSRCRCRTGSSRASRRSSCPAGS